MWFATKRFALPSAADPAQPAALISVGDSNLLRLGEIPGEIPGEILCVADGGEGRGDVQLAVPLLWRLAKRLDVRLGMGVSAMSMLWPPPAECVTADDPPGADVTADSAATPPAVGTLLATACPADWALPPAAKPTIRGACCPCCTPKASNALGALLALPPAAAVLAAAAAAGWSWGSGTGLPGKGMPLP